MVVCGDRAGRGEGGKQNWETDSVDRVKDAAPRRRYIVQHERPSIAPNPRRSLESLDSSPTLVTSVPEVANTTNAKSSIAMAPIALYLEL